MWRLTERLITELAKVGKPLGSKHSALVSREDGASRFNLVVAIRESTGCGKFVNFGEDVCD
jgi:hypothetical protein